MPLGKFAAWVLPRTRFNTFGYRWSFNPGPFNVKEHTVITAMGIMTWTTPFILSAYIVQEVNYGQHLPYSYKIVNNRAYHHGTMLISTELGALGDLLRTHKVSLVCRVPCSRLLAC